MKYLILLAGLMSVSVQADEVADANDPRVAAVMSEAAATINMLVDKIESMNAQWDKDLEHSLMLRGFLVKITDNCNAGNDFVSIDEANNIHQFHCMKEIK